MIYKFNAVLRNSVVTAFEYPQAFHLFYFRFMRHTFGLNVDIKKDLFVMSGLF
jgi:hypothetical protein